MWNTTIYKLENEPKSSKVISKYLIIGSKFGFMSPFMIKKYQTLGN